VVLREIGTDDVPMEAVDAVIHHRGIGKTTR